MKKLIFAITTFTLFLSISLPVNAKDKEKDSAKNKEDQITQEEQPQQEIKYKAKILNIEEGMCPETQGKGNCLFFDLEIISGDKKGEKIESTASISDDPKLRNLNYKENDQVYVVETQVGDEVAYYVKEPVRRNSLLGLLIVFIIAVIAVGRLQGVSSLLGLLASFAILRALVLPMLLSGTNPLLASIVGGIMILTVSVYLSHGFNKKTSIALIGTIISLIITGLLAMLYTQLTRLTGYATDESTFLVNLLDNEIDMRGILLSSLIIGGIGILDDVTVSQVSTVQEILKANPSLSPSELFKRSMNVGRDHIASMVNTLVLAYTGSALPLVMLFIASGSSFEEIVNVELVAEEIVRTLGGSIGLICAVPITTFLATKLLQKNTNQTTFRRNLR